MIKSQEKAYMFERLSPEKLVKWTKKLKYFRFFRAVGGHANDCDRLVIKIPLQQGLSQSNLFRKLGFDIPAAAEKELDRIRDQYLHTHLSQKACRSSLFGPGFHYHGFDGALFIEKWGSGGPLDVTDEDVAVAAAFETAIDGQGLKFSMPPSKLFNCFCEEHYPEYFVA